MRASRRMAVCSVGGQYENLFTYTGTYSYINDGGKNWRLKFLTSGLFTPARNVRVDLFAVGGGGGGRAGSSGRAAGGGGGYTTTVRDVLLTAGMEYEVQVGGGGEPALYIGEGIGEASYLCENMSRTTIISAAGGGSPEDKFYQGGSGGSGGGGSSNSSGTKTAAGGKDGGNGWDGETTGHGGTGQGTTTREFGEPTGDLYAGGGGGAPKQGETGWPGGDGGGGAAGSDGTANTGGGGGALGGSGGSGIIIIRNVR